jgi:hypothetical protein
VNGDYLLVLNYLFHLCKHQSESAGMDPEWNTLSLLLLCLASALG